MSGSGAAVSAMTLDRGAEAPLSSEPRDMHDIADRYRALVLAMGQLSWTSSVGGRHDDGDARDWRLFTGQEPGHVRAWGWLEAVHPEDRDRTVAAWESALATKCIYETEYRARRHDGEYRWLLVRGVPVMETDGSVREWVGVATDITERKLLEAELRASERRKDEFLGIASHELRTPLTSAKTSVQYVARRLARTLDAPGADVEETLAQLRPLQDLLKRGDAALDRLGRLVSDLLDISRIQAGKLQMRVRRVALPPIVRDAADEETRAWPDRSVRLVGLADDENRTSPSGAILVEGDPDRIGQVVTNYLSNAFKYAPPNRPITVQLETFEHMARVSVRDEGPGLTLEQQRSLFERFYRVEGIVHQQGSILGLGLGLSICREIVERHGGRVGVDSEPGAGSTFWFTLPLAQGKAGVAESPKAETPQA